MDVDNKCLPVCFELRLNTDSKVGRIILSIPYDITMKKFEIANTVVNIAGLFRHC